MGLELEVSVVQPLLNDDVLPKGGEHLVLVQGLSLVPVALLQEGGAAPLSNCLVLLLVGLCFFTISSFQLTASKESDAFGVQIECFLDSLEHPLVGCTFLDNCVHEMLWTICAQADQKLL